MAKQCPECRTVVADDAAFCDACRLQFARIPAAGLPRAGFWKLAAITVIVVAVITLVLFFRANG